MKRALFMLFSVLPFLSFAQWGGILHKIGGGGSSLADGIPATSADLSGYGVIGVDAAGNVYIKGLKVRKINAATGIITTVAGNGGYAMDPTGDGGLATAAELGQINNGFAVDGAGNIYISYGSASYNGIRKVNVATGNIDTIYGKGVQAPVSFDGAGNMYFCGQEIAIAIGSPTYIKKKDRNTGALSLIAGNDTAMVSGSYGGLLLQHYFLRLPEYLRIRQGMCLSGLLKQA